MIQKTLILFFVLFFLAGCSNKSPEVRQMTSNEQVAFDEFDEFEDEFAQSSQSDFDPLSGYNRAMTTFNDAAMTNVLIPISQGYKEIIPPGARSSLGNFFDNLLYPVRLANNILQGKFKNALDETNRFLLNTAVGFLGFADVATDIYEIEKHDEDFGQTLGYWGVPAGPHIVVPILGPSNLRDFSASFADGWISPLNYVSNRDVNLINTYFEGISVNALDSVNLLSDNYGIYQGMTKDAIDLYPLLKNMYEQRREALIKE